MNPNIQTSSPSRHRPPPLHLPDDPRAAAALALALIRGDDSFNRAEAVEGLTARIAKLSDAGSAASLEELAAHLPILEALFMRFTADAMTTNMTGSKAALIRMALAAQTSYSRTVVLLAGLKLQRDGKALVTVQGMEGDS